MIEEEIEKLRTLANNNEELVRVVAKRIIDEYNDIGHYMGNSVALLDTKYIIRAQVVCKSCGMYLFVTILQYSGYLSISYDTKEKCI
jgi:hypothetical protein